MGEFCFEAVACSGDDSFKGVSGEVNGTRPSWLGVGQRCWCDGLPDSKTASGCVGGCGNPFR